MTPKKSTPRQRTASLDLPHDKEMTKYHECWQAMQMLLVESKDDKPQASIRSFDRAARTFALRSKSKVLRARAADDAFSLASVLPTLPGKQSLNTALELLRYACTHQSCVFEIYFRIMEARTKFLQHGDATNAALAEESLAKFVQYARSQVEAVEKWIAADLKGRKPRGSKKPRRAIRKRGHD